jgi:type I restriction enzyme S subunit
MTWPSYSSTKPSDVEWLGSVPSHWDVRQLKWGSPVRRGASPRPIDDSKYFDDDGEWSWVRIADVSASDGVLKETRQRLSTLGSSLSVKLNPGSLFVSIAGTVGKPCITAIPACIHDGFVYFPGLDLNPQYLFRIFESGECYRGLGKFGTQLNLNTDTIGSIRMPVPPQPEQEEIVEFLDRETAKIDVLIDKQEQLIATLREDRTATITHAVTKGLDPDAELQDSGVEWLGNVPAHWRQTQLRHLLGRIEQGVSPQAYADLAYEGWGVLKAGCVNAGTFADTQHKKLPDDFEIDPGIVVNEGDLLVCRASGSADFVGSTAIVRQLRYQLILSDKIFRLVPGTLVLPDYLEWAMKSRMYREQVGGAISGAEGLANNLPMSALKTFRFPLPPLDEQEQISVYLDARCETIDALIAKAKEVIKIMREYRSALITDAVTGKLDARGAA